MQDLTGKYIVRAKSIGLLLAIEGAEYKCRSVLLLVDIVAMMSVLLGNLHELSCERLDIRSLLIDETESS
jgi:hypothetical protein